MLRRGPHLPPHYGTRRDGTGGRSKPWAPRQDPGAVRPTGGGPRQAPRCPETHRNGPRLRSEQHVGYLLTKAHVARAARRSQVSGIRGPYGIDPSAHARRPARSCDAACRSEHPGERVRPDGRWPRAALGSIPSCERARRVEPWLPDPEDLRASAQLHHSGTAVPLASMY
jgi:hypothetical protein